MSNKIENQPAYDWEKSVVALRFFAFSHRLQVVAVPSFDHKAIAQVAW